MASNWFTKLCRNTGLMVHNIVKPEEESRKQTVSKKVQQKQIDDQVTLRRTTIDEIEIRPDRRGEPASRDDNDSRDELGNT